MESLSCYLTWTSRTSSTLRADGAGRMICTCRNCKAASVPCSLYLSWSSYSWPGVAMATDIGLPHSWSSFISHIVLLRTQLRVAVCFRLCAVCHTSELVSFSYPVHPPYQTTWSWQHLYIFANSTCISLLCPTKPVAGNYHTDNNNCFFLLHPTNLYPGRHCTDNNCVILYHPHTFSGRLWSTIVLQCWSCACLASCRLVHSWRAWERGYFTSQYGTLF